MSNQQEPTTDLSVTFLDWLRENVDHIVASSNYTVSMMMFALGSIVLYYLFKIKFSGKTDIKFMLSGIVLEAYGWCLHRFYWGQWREARLFKDEPLQQWFIDNAYLALVPSFMVIAGLILIVGPALSWAIRSSKRWTIYAATILLSFSIFWWHYWRLEEGFRLERQEKAAARALKQQMRNLRKSPISTDTRPGVKILRPNAPPTFLNSQQRPLGPGLTNPNRSLGSKR